MRLNVSYKYMERSSFVENILDKSIKKIERRVLMYKKDSPIHVSVHLEKNPHKEEFFCRSQVYLPSKVLAAQEKGATLAVAINKSISAISRQLGKVKDRLEHLHRRPSRGSKNKDTEDVI